MKLELIHPNHDVTDLGCHCCSDYVQARLILKQVVELVEQFKRVNANGQCTGYIVPATVIAQLRSIVEGK
jgi:hypothetical protein